PHVGRRHHLDAQPLRLPVLAQRFDGLAVGRRRDDDPLRRRFLLRAQGGGDEQEQGEENESWLHARLRNGEGGARPLLYPRGVFLAIPPLFLPSPLWGERLGVRGAFLPLPLRGEGLGVRGKRLAAPDDQEDEKQRQP